MKASDCIFCKIANGEIPSQTIYEDNLFRVILDISPVSEGHALIILKEHYKDLTEVPEEIAQKALPLAKRLGIAMMETLGCSAFNVLQNNGAAAGQTVFHFHMHVIPRYEDGPAMLEITPLKMGPETLGRIADMIRAAI